MSIEQLMQRIQAELPGYTVKVHTEQVWYPGGSYENSQIQILDARGVIGQSDTKLALNSPDLAISDLKAAAAAGQVVVNY